MGKQTKNFALGAVFAAVAGFIAGILTAPKSGKDTRTDIKNAATTSISEAEKQLKKLNTQLTSLLGEVKEQANTAKGKVKAEMDEVLDKAGAVREKAREVLSSVHDGDVEDKDLKKAIDDATKAVDNLKAHIKKSA